MGNRKRYIHFATLLWKRQIENERNGIDRSTSGYFLYPSQYMFGIFRCLKGPRASPKYISLQFFWVLYGDQFSVGLLWTCWESPHIHISKDFPCRQSDSFFWWPYPCPSRRSLGLCLWPWQSDWTIGDLALRKFRCTLLLRTPGRNWMIYTLLWRSPFADRETCLFEFVIEWTLIEFQNLNWMFV